ncbi:PepSY domain-containing protein [Sunxiuqinia sp. A32]|uniref:PepSY domain-containing protein n=1 Tax=Sunxiuqinia sp. A32 TaxID=3461496 RepID=UPI004045FFC8
MGKNRSLKLFRKLHKWPGIVIALLAILFALSGIVLNHRSVFSSVDFNRNWLPSDYQYKNWNLAAVRGGLSLDSANTLLYGNIGMWKIGNGEFSDFAQGFPNGIDHRKVYKLAILHDQLFAATHFGLYTRKLSDGNWDHVTLPVKESRLTDLLVKQDTLVVMTRHYLLRSDDGDQFEVIQLPPPVGYRREAGLFQTLWQLHSGELFGVAGKLFVDLLGAVVILLAITGLLHFFFPKIAKQSRRKQKDNKKLSATRKLNLRWHNVVGYIFIGFLILNTTAGMFLRPPLLIPIANSKVGLIPGTHLDNPNPWFDKLRRVEWNGKLNSYIISTSDGFYRANEGLNQPLTRFAVQPPVSVMGCNVLEAVGKSAYLVGSFSGLFIWDLERQLVIDAFTKQPPKRNTGRPISDHLVAGYLKLNDSEHYLFDYSSGMQNLKGLSNWEMPKEIINKSPMSLWNTALEIHTGRIFEHLIGPFYILYVPLSGLCLIMVLVSGFLIWWKAYRR